MNVKSIIMDIPPSREEIIDYLLDPRSGEPLRRDFVERQSDKRLQRMAELSGDGFKRWLFSERSAAPEGEGGEND